MPITIDDATAEALRPLIVQHVASLLSQVAGLQKFLGRGKPGRPTTHAITANSNGTGAGRRGWSAAQRKAAGERMRKYWASKKGRARRRTGTER